MSPRRPWLHELPHRALRVARVGTAGHQPVAVTRWWRGGQALVAQLEAQPDIGRGPGLLGVGPAADVAAIVARCEPAEVDYASLTRGTLALCPTGTAAAWGWARASLWDWFYAQRLPPHNAHEDSVHPAPWGSDLRAQLAELLREANPTTDFDPRRDEGEWWAACDGHGQALACGAAHIGAGDVHFGAVATATHARRQGWARAVVGHMTRHYLGLDCIVTLGMWADNGPARSLYESLGFAVAHAVETWRC